MLNFLVTLDSWPYWLVDNFFFQLQAQTIMNFEIKYGCK